MTQKKITEMYPQNIRNRMHSFQHAVFSNPKSYILIVHSLIIYSSLASFFRMGLFVTLYKTKGQNINKYLSLEYQNNEIMNPQLSKKKSIKISKP